MSWFSNVNLANLGDLAGAVNNLGDLAGAVNKFSEGVKSSIELNFDPALLGIEEKEQSNDVSTSEGILKTSADVEDSSSPEEKAAETSGTPPQPMQGNGKQAQIERAIPPSASDVKEVVESVIGLKPVSNEQAIGEAGMKERELLTPSKIDDAIAETFNDHALEPVNETERGKDATFGDDAVVTASFAAGDNDGNIEVVPLATTPETAGASSALLDPGDKPVDVVSAALQSNETASDESVSPAVDVVAEEHGVSFTSAREEQNLPGAEQEVISTKSIGNDGPSSKEHISAEETTPAPEVASADLHIDKLSNESRDPPDSPETLNFTDSKASVLKVEGELHDSQSASEAVAESAEPLPGLSQEDVGEANVAFPVSEAKQPVAMEVAQAPSNDSAPLQKEIAELEVALQAAARQAQTKADELSEFMILNDNLRGEVQSLRQQVEGAKEQEKQAVQAAMDALREEYQIRISAAERKVYALTKERDMLKREQSRKTDTSALLKEKDEIIKQVMAEGEELSKKQAAQELAMKKLRSQIRELEDDKQRLTAKLQVEEARVESSRKEKVQVEKSLTDTVERSLVELQSQKEMFGAALSEAREALAQAQAQADSQARSELERRLREAAERERSLTETVEELRQGLSRTEQQAALREEMLRRDVAGLERRCQAAEERHEELMARIPDSTRPLLRQIEAMQETANMRVEVLSGVEKALNARLQEALAKAASAEERERACSDRLSQTVSRLSVMETQLGLLRVEQGQLSRSLEKERARAAEARQELLASLERVATEEGRVRQLEESLHDSEIRTKQERARRQQLEQELLALQQQQQQQQTVQQSSDSEQEAGMSALRSISSPSPSVAAATSPSIGQGPPVTPFPFKRGGLLVEGRQRESAILAASLGPSPPPATASGSLLHEGNGAGFPLLTAASLEQMETLLRHKDGELATWAQRVASLESTRDSLAEELVKSSQQFESLRVEWQALSGVRAELESLRRRHTSALELMGERDEQVEELRADLTDVKQMYREQIDLLVNQIQDLSVQVSSLAVAKE